jgi:hypothetical protein
MTDTALVFNAIGRDNVTPLFSKLKGAFTSTSAVAKASMAEASRDVNKLDNEIEEATRDLQKLAKEFVFAGGAVEKLQIGRAMAKQRAEIGRLVKVRDLLPKPSEIAAEGASFVGKLVGGITSKLSPAMATAAPAIGGAVAVAAPFIGGVIAGAVVGGAGIGGVVGGIAIASKDSRVQSSAKDLGDLLKQQMQSAAEPFVPASLRAINIVRGEFIAMEGDIRSVMDNSAGYVEPLTRGIGGMMREVVSGFEDANAAAGPVIAVISDKLPALGASIGGIFTALSDNAESGAQAVGLLMDGIIFTIDMTTNAVNFLAEAWEFAMDVPGMATLFQVLSDGVPKIDSAKNSTIGFNEATKETDRSATEAAAGVKSLYDQMNELNEQNLSVFDSQVRASEAISDTTKAIDKNGKATNNSTAAGRANNSALSSLAKAFNQVTTANDKAGTAAAQANKTYERQREKLIAAAVAAGYSGDKARQFANDVLKIPQNRTVKVSAQTETASAKLRNMKQLINGMDGRTIDIAMRVTGTSSVSAAASALRKNSGREFGGPVTKGEAYVVGEKRAEIFIPDQNGTIAPSLSEYSRSAGSAAGVAAGRGGGSSGGGAPVAIIELRGPRQLTEMWRKSVRTNNLVQVRVG